MRKKVLVAGCVTAGAMLAWRIRGADAFDPVYWFAFVAAHPFVAPVLFVPVYATAMICFVPTLPLNLLAGALWGPVIGSVLALVGSVSGAVLAFLIARGLLGQPLAKHFDQELVARLQQDFTRYDWKVMAFVRLNPLFPGPVNFVFGLTSMALWTYVWTTTVFLIPLTVIFSVLGWSIGGLVFERSMTNVRNVLLLAGGSIAVLTLCAVLLRHRRWMREKPEL